MAETKEMSLEEMVRIRPVSQKISEILRKRLVRTLETMGPLFSPRNYLGQYVQSAFKERVKGADDHFHTIQEEYRRVCQAPFHLPSKLVSPLPAIKSRLEIYPYEYTCQIGSDPVTTVKMTSPVKWVLGYSSGYNYSRFRNDVSAGEKKNQDAIRGFIVNSLLIELAFKKNPGVRKILEVLRFPVQSEVPEGLGLFSVTTISSILPSFRPADDIVLGAVQMSGGSVFEELIDLDAVHTIEDPLKEEILRGAGL